MIFVTIGSMFPFDRLVRSVDAIAQRMPQETFFAQIGDGAYEPVHMEFARMLSRRDFMDKLRSANLLVAHAGMGSVISALEVGVPIVMLPRKASLGEVNTDHQLATARWLDGRPGLDVCFEDEDLGDVIARAVTADRKDRVMDRTAPQAFTDKIRQFIHAS
ncbi:MAG: glucuronosyltransferase [Proteobacteria bacterium]|nr:glucuronosyltransferase [Pseudomonadota bacterium]